MMPLAPGLFSTITAWPSSFVMDSASMRLTTSAPEPGPWGTTILMGRVGKSWAEAAKAAASARQARRRRVIIKVYMPDRDDLGHAWRVTPTQYLARRPATHEVPQPTSTYVTMRDGVRLAVDVYLPQPRPGTPASETFPTIVILTPYY